MSENAYLREAVEAAIRNMVRAEHHARGSLVSVPIRYPSGALAVVEITEVGDRCFVTDFGMAHREAVLCGATRQFERRAAGIAASFGIRYDGRAFFVAEVPKDRLAGAIIIVANCSQKAVALAAMKAAEKSEADMKDAVFERISNVFGKANVAREASFRGASSHDWPIDFLVRANHRPLIIETATPHQGSVVNVTTRLHDISRLEQPPPRLIIVQKKEPFGDLLGVMAPVASAVLEVGAANDDFLRFSQAA